MTRQLTGDSGPRRSSIPAVLAVGAFFFIAAASWVLVPSAGDANAEHQSVAVAASAGANVLPSHLVTEVLLRVGEAQKTLRRANRSVDRVPSHLDGTNRFLRVNGLSRLQRGVKDAVTEAQSTQSYVYQALAQLALAETAISTHFHKENSQ